MIFNNINFLIINIYLSNYNSSLIVDTPLIILIILILLIIWRLIFINLLIIKLFKLLYLFFKIFFEEHFVLFIHILSSIFPNLKIVFISNCHKNSLTLKNCCFGRLNFEIFLIILYYYFLFYSKLDLYQVFINHFCLIL